MTLQDFQRLLKATPFRPFRIAMSSGEKYDVVHPEIAMLFRTSIFLALSPDKDGIYSDWTMCSLLHVTAVEPISEMSKRSGRRKSA